jgi:hypothetical protein
VETVKDDKPTAKDVMKTAANMEGIDSTYNQSYRALQSSKLSKMEIDESSFQLIHPYLQRFAELNPNSVIKVENTRNNNIKRLFICPGIMKRSLKFVRPVMSLDAAHLKSKWGGTLYIASVKTGNDKIFPVAIAIMKEKENYNGWEWFLECLNKAVGQVLCANHPDEHIHYKHFSFISDRQKGLVDALKNVFPDNHAMHCAIHIARNTEVKVGGKKFLS